MIFDNNTAYQTYRILVAIFGTLGMLTSTTLIKKSYKRNLLLFGGYAVYAIVFSFIFIRFEGFLFFLRGAVFTISLPGVIVSYLIADTSLARHVFCALSQLLLSLYLIISVTILNIFWGGTVSSGAILLLPTYLIVIFLEFFFLRKPFLKIADTITKGWGILSSIPSSFFILSMAVILYPAHYTQNPSSLLLFYLLGVVILIIYYAIFQYLWTQYKYRIEEQNQEILDLQIQNIRNHAKETKRKAEEVRKISQDMHHMLSAIAIFAREGNAEAILAYVAEASAKNDIACPARYCSDPILNATLTTYLNRAKNSDITTELYLAIPESLPVDSAELSICFANALENAIKANEKLPKNERKMIVKCIHKPTFMFEIENPYTGRISFDKNGLPQALKTGHGIGTRSIMAFCERHNAFFTFTADGSWFKLVVTL